MDWRTARRRVSSASLESAGGTGAGDRISGSLAGFHPHARAQLVLAVGDDLFAGIETAVDQRHAILDLCDLDRPRLYPLVGLDDVGEVALRPTLDDRRRHGDAVVA